MDCQLGFQRKLASSHSSLVRYNEGSTSDPYKGYKVLCLTRLAGDVVVLHGARVPSQGVPASRNRGRSLDRAAAAPFLKFGRTREENALIRRRDRMDALTNFLFSEQALSLDADLDSMLANLPQQAEGVVNLNPIIPFQTSYEKMPGTQTWGCQGVPTTKSPFQNCQCFWTSPSIALWHSLFSRWAAGRMGLPYEPLKQDGAFPTPGHWDDLGAQMDAAPPLFSTPMQAPHTSVLAGAVFAQQAPQALTAVQQMPPLQEKDLSPRSSDGRDEPDYAKLQERIQKQKDKNARNQRQFRKRVWL